eukprot:4532335-Amphidinium_carterae.1
MCHSCTEDVRIKRWGHLLHATCTPSYDYTYFCQDVWRELQNESTAASIFAKWVSLGTTPVIDDSSIRQHRLGNSFCDSATIKTYLCKLVGFASLDWLTKSLGRLFCKSYLSKWVPRCFHQGKPLGSVCRALAETLGDLAYSPEIQATASICFWDVTANVQMIHGKPLFGREKCHTTRRRALVNIIWLRVVMFVCPQYLSIAFSRAAGLTEPKTQMKRN